MSNKKKKNQILRNKNEENNKNEIESLDEYKNIIKKEEELKKQDKKSLSLINSNIIEGNIFIKNTGVRTFFTYKRKINISQIRAIEK